MPNSLPAPILDEEKKLSEIFIFILFCGASKGFMKASKAPRRSVKIKLSLNFNFDKTFRNPRDGKGKKIKYNIKAISHSVLFIAFAFNLKSFANAFLVFFLHFFLLVTFSGWTAKSFWWKFYHKLLRKRMTRVWLIPWKH